MLLYKISEKEGKLWTYTDTNMTKALIDYAFINKKWNNSALNSEAYSSYEFVSSDHQIVTAKIRLSLRMHTARITTTAHND